MLAQFVLLGPALATAISAIPVSTVSTAPFRLGAFGNAGTNGFVADAPVYLTDGIITFGGTAGIYDGNVSNVVASPTGTGNYLAAEPGGAITFTFSAPQSQFQLLWGSVDTYNSLTFSSADGTAMTITGADILAADNTDQPAYVTISGLNNVTKIVASSSSPAFEFLPNVQVPEPGTLALLAAGLSGLAWMRRRRF